MPDPCIRVLLVDDHVVVRNGIRMMLGAAGDIEVAAETESGQQALSVVRHQEFDVALVDLNMPGMNGLDLVKHLRDIRPQMAVLILSMYAEDVYAVRALKQGAAGYLTKNSSADVVIAAVKKVAEGGRYLSLSMLEKLAGLIGRDAGASHEALSDRELEVLKLLAAGESLVRIADRLHLSPSTVTTYRARILDKMGMQSNAELARYALENGLLG